MTTTDIIMGIVSIVAAIMWMSAVNRRADAKRHMDMLRDGVIPPGFMIKLPAGYEFERSNNNWWIFHQWPAREIHPIDALIASEARRIRAEREA